MSKIKVVNIDMDGVIYDLVGAVAYLDGYSYQGRWMENIYVDKGTNHLDYINNIFDTSVDKGLFTEGSLCNDAIELLEHVLSIKSDHDLKINLLGALPKNHDKSDRIKADKMTWLESNDLVKYFDDIIFVNGSSAKLFHATKDSILIDDFGKTHKQFEEADMPFILHRSTKETIKHLNNYGLIYK